MSALLDQLLLHAAPSQTQQRDAARLRGLPQARDERWRYSSLRALNARQFAAQPARSGVVSEALRAHIQALPLRVVLVDGWYAANLSTLGDRVDVLALSIDYAHSRSPPAHLPFALAAAAAAQTTLTIQVADGSTITEPLHLVSITTSVAHDAIVQHALQLKLGRGAVLQVARHRLHAGGGSAFGNEWRAIELNESAQLTWCEHGEESDTATQVTATGVMIGGDARLDFAEVAAGAGLYRHDLDVLLQGDRGAVAVRGCTAVNQRRHADIAIDVRHVARDTRADIVWRGLADQRGHAIFAGQLIVAAGADGSDTALSNKNLLLSAHAEIDTRPVLEIHADEVKAAHGATVGQLDERSLFYLRARGIPATDAKRILTLAFAREPLLQIVDGPLRVLLLDALARSLPE